MMMPFDDRHILHFKDPGSSPNGIMICATLSSLLLLLLLMPLPVTGNWLYDSEDMQLFDLVEEVNGTFYEFMNLNGSATPADVKKAFRSLSLKLHPDKSDEPDADVKFRQLVSISEVLRDESKRSKYDKILENGLPDWKTGLYYIRRARKLGLMEMSILVSLILTIGHYLCLIAAYYEKVYEVSEVIKRKGKKMKKAEYDDFFNQVMELNNISKPRIAHDNLPIKTILFVYFLATQTPVLFTWTSDWIRSQVSATVKNHSSPENESEDEIVKPRVKKVRTKIQLPDLTGMDDESDENDSEAHNVISSSVPASVLHEKNNEWRQDEILLLIKLTKKFPPGTNQRWERIACSIGRSVEDVIKMSKNIREGSVKINEPLISTSGNSKQQQQQLNSDDISSRDVVVVVPVVENAAQNWSQADQQLLEEGLQKIPRGIEGRWDKIAEYTGRSKEDCMNRFKWLAEIVKRKKESTTKT